MEAAEDYRFVVPAHPFEAAFSHRLMSLWRFSVLEWRLYAVPDPLLSSLYTSVRREA